jgi:rhodanese-related sulfurtransferase
MPQEVTISQLASLSKPLVLDVREVDEFISGHVPGALNLPLSELLERVGDVPVAPEVYVICQAGGRSLRACEYLSGLEQFSGTEFVNVAGGTGMWIVEGHEVAVGE